MSSFQLEDFRPLAAFVGLPEAELTWLLAHAQAERLAIGDYFAQAGQPSERFYVVLEGELQISRREGDHETVVGTTPAGIMGGEYALLSDELIADFSARAILPTSLIIFDKATFRQIFFHCPVFAARIFHTACERIQGRAVFTVQQEKMAALGKLSAGLAHELNNPASAALRSAQTLHDALPTLQTRAMQLNTCDLSPAHLDHLIAFQQQMCAQSATVTPLSTIAQSDCEDEMADWLADLGIAEAWNLAPTFVAAGVTPLQLAEFSAKLPDESVGKVLSWLHEALATNSLLAEIEESTNRVARLVKAVKEYTYMDQAPVQEVDLNRSLETTLRVLAHKLRDVTVSREFAPDLPSITARGGELNQVWTNLIDNAADALREKPAGEAILRIITRSENDFVMVEVTDNGPGVPPEVQPRVFEPFFTTKGVGMGNGLGLDICYRIIQQHHGTIELRSVPGNTRFIIRLPLHTDS